MSSDRAITVHFMDGSKISFDFREQAANEAAKQIKLEEMLKSQHLLVEADGAFMIFPIANIKSIQFLMPPEISKVKLPAAAIRGATVVG